MRQKQQNQGDSLASLMALANQGNPLQELSALMQIMNSQGANERANNADQRAQATHAQQLKFGPQEMLARLAQMQAQTGNYAIQQGNDVANREQAMGIAKINQTIALGGQELQRNLNSDSLTSRELIAEKQLQGILARVLGSKPYMPGAPESTPEMRAIQEMINR